MSSPNSLAQSRSPRRTAKLSKWASRPGLSVGLGGGEGSILSATDVPSDASTFPSSQAILRGKSIIVIFDATAARQEICGALYRDEKNPEASWFCVKPGGCRIAGHKLGEKSFPTEGIYVHEYNTKRKSNCFHKPRGNVKISEVHKAALLSADTSSLSHTTRRAFWAKAFELLKSIDNSAEGKDCLYKLYQEYSNPLSISETHDTSDEEDDNYLEDDSQNSSEIKITQIDLQQNRPDDELPFSLQEASKLCEVEPTNTDKQEATTLALLVKTADSTGEILPTPFQLPHFGFKGYEAAKKLCETSSTLFSRSTQFSFQLDEFNSTLQQLKDSYDRRVSKPANVLFKEKNLWHALQTVKTSITLNEGCPLMSCCSMRSNPC